MSNRKALTSASRPLSDVISVSCEEAHGPGLEWVIKVEMRRLKRGYSVWFYEDNATTDRPRWRKVASNAHPLTWRAAYSTIAGNENFRVFGEFWRETEILGVSGLEADAMRLAFIVDEESPYNYRRLGDFLLGFSDEELRALVPGAGLDPHAKPYADTDDECPSAFQKMDYFAESASSTGLVGHCLAEIRSALGAGSEATLDDLIRMIGEKAKVIKSAAREKHISNFIRATKGQTVSNSRYQEWHELSQESLPETIAQQIDLIECWLLENEGGDSSDWAILMWLFRGAEERLAELHVRRPELAVRLANEVMRRGKKAAYYFEGPNRLPEFRDVRGKYAYRAPVEWALSFQTAADTLGIQFEESYRIDQLPYLHPPKKN